MKKYDPKRRCPKCGGNARTIYQGDRWNIGEYETTKRGDGSRMSPGTIHRECERCFYTWGELPLDVQEPNK